MTQEQVNLVLGIMTVLGPAIGFILRDAWRKRKTGTQYSDDLLVTTNTVIGQLKMARQEIADIESQLRQQDTQHQQELDDLQHQHKRERERLRKRLNELEATIRSYDVSFTLRTHPEVRVDNVKVVGKEDVFDSQKLQAITPQQVLDAQEAKKKK
jgi:DNA-binding transcriptional MerR regulator